ncbi:MAG: S8 family peptidase [Roseiflexaceae bacterium]|nr:S8 family peptidase [Roseiflexaceae bacterium]
MLYRTNTLLTIIIAITLLTSGSVAHATTVGPVAYVESAIAQSQDAKQSVIVTATSPERATQAVQQVGGVITSDLWLIDAVAADVPTSKLNLLAGMPGIQSIVANKGVRSTTRDGWVTDLPLPQTWDGRPDVQPTDNKSVWKLVNPVTIDIGADVVQRTLLPSGKPIKGLGITVALVDSGVYFDNEIKQLLDPVVQRLFLGQADFVEPICSTTTVNGRTRTIGNQLRNACLVTHRDTSDPYGHGTAIASIIWNNFTDYDTGVTLGVAPEANILSVRVLDGNGTGSYETVINGIQYVVQNKARFNIGVLNLSLSSPATTPYFVDPLNRAVERAWGRGIVVVTAAGNNGSAAESITVPGNDPYVITVGSIDENRTPGYWSDDFLPTWSSTGPTLDGFAKPDLLAPGVNIITFMHNDASDTSKSQKIVQMHPDNAAGTSLFRMSGTSMSAAITSGVVALMLQANPDLEPNAIKFRLSTTARPAVTGDTGSLVYNVFQQGMGRIWAPDAVLGTFDGQQDGNPGMQIHRDIAHSYRNDRDLSFHYQGPIQKVLSNDGQANLYYIVGEQGDVLGLAGSWKNGMAFIDNETLASGRMAWASGRMAWASSLSTAAGRMAWASGRMAWASSRNEWAGGTAWNTDQGASASGRMAWASDLNPSITSVSTTTWVESEMP